MNAIVSHWPANAVVVAAYVLVAAAHLSGLRGATMGARQPGGCPPGWRAQAVLFHAGLLTVLAALVSPLAFWSRQLIWVRSVQDLLLAIVAPALIVLGAPWLPLRRAIGRPLPGEPPEPAAPEGPVGLGRARWPRPPLLAAAAFNLAWCGWHLAAPYDAALRHPAAYAAEVLCYLGLGIVFWRQLTGSWPYRPRLAPLRRVMLVTGTAIVGTVLAIVLVFSSSLFYSGYLGARHASFSVVADQQVGGAVLWVLMLVPYVVVAMALVTRWLKDEESQALAAGLDRLLKPAKPAWPSRPGLR
jgi:putative membrane protein